MTIYSLHIILSRFGTSLLFHVQFQLLLHDLNTDFSGGRSDGLVFPSLEEFSSLLWSTVKGFGIINKAEIDAFLDLSCFFYEPMDVSNWSLVPLPFLNPAWTSGSSHTVEAWLGEFWVLLCKRVIWVELCNNLNILWHWPFPDLWPLLSFPNLLAYWVQHFNSIIF